MNDNDPTFSPNFYEASMAEDQPPGKIETKKLIHSNERE